MKHNFSIQVCVGEKKLNGFIDFPLFCRARWSCAVDGNSEIIDRPRKHDGNCKCKNVFLNLNNVTCSTMYSVNNCSTPVTCKIKIK